MNVEENVYRLIVCTVLVDALVEFLKVIFNRYLKSKECKNILLRIGSIIIGISICFNYNFDFIGAFGLGSKVSYLGYILTGIFISRGSNVIHDTLKKFGLKNTKL